MRTNPKSGIEKDFPKVNDSQPPQYKSGSNPMVRLSDEAHKNLKRWAAQDGTTLQAALEKAIDEYDRHRFFESADAAYRRLRANPEEWEVEVAERREWEATLIDGIDPNEIWNDDGSVTYRNEVDRKIV